jgi:hypothetical protein
MYVAGMKEIRDRCHVARNLFSFLFIADFYFCFFSLIDSAKFALAPARDRESEQRHRYGQ